MELDAVENSKRLRKIRDDKLQATDFIIAWEEAERRKFKQ